MEWNYMGNAPHNRRVLFRMTHAAGRPGVLFCGYDEMTNSARAYATQWADLPANQATADLIVELIRKSELMSESIEEYKVRVDSLSHQLELVTQTNTELYTEKLEAAASKWTPGLEWRSLAHFPVPMTDRHKPILFYFPEVGSNKGETVHLIPYISLNKLGHSRATHWAYWDHSPIVLSYPVPVIEEEGFAIPYDPAPAHLDDNAIDIFTNLMKAKMEKSRKIGKGGWQGCAPENLRWLLRSAVERGDPVDVANFAMMLSYLNEPTAKGGFNGGFEEGVKWQKARTGEH